jgi:hypothetical protein
MAQEMLTVFQVRADSKVFMMWVEIKDGNILSEFKMALFWDVTLTFHFVWGFRPIIHFHTFPYNMVGL